MKENVQFTSEELQTIRNLCALAFSISLPQGVGGIEQAKLIVLIDKRAEEQQKLLESSPSPSEAKDSE